MTASATYGTNLLRSSFITEPLVLNVDSVIVIDIDGVSKSFAMTIRTGKVVELNFHHSKTSKLALSSGQMITQSKL